MRLTRRKPHVAAGKHVGGSGLAALALTLLPGAAPCLPLCLPACLPAPQIAPVMGAGYHTIHHTLYNYNYGHYFTFVDRCGAMSRCSMVWCSALWALPPAPYGAGCRMRCRRGNRGH